MFQPLDGPSEQTSLSVGTTQVEAKVGTTALEERKVLTIQPLDGRVRVLFKSGLSATSGFLIYKRQIVRESGTTNVIIVERA